MWYGQFCHPNTRRDPYFEAGRRAFLYPYRERTPGPAASTDLRDCATTATFDGRHWAFNSLVLFNQRQFDCNFRNGSISVNSKNYFRKYWWRHCVRPYLPIVGSPFHHIESWVSVYTGDGSSGVDASMLHIWFCSFSFSCIPPLECFNLKENSSTSYSACENESTHCMDDDEVILRFAMSSDALPLRRGLYAKWRGKCMLFFEVKETFVLRSYSSFP